MLKKRKKILFAAVDIGYRIEVYTNFIEKNLDGQLQADSFSKYVLPKEHYKTQYTYTCPIDKTHPWILYSYSFIFFIFSLFKYDIFHFFSGETILTRKLRRFEFFIYKLLGKRIIMHFVGADIRNPNYLIWKEKNIDEFLKGKKPIPLTLKWQDKLIKDSLKYADEILVSTPDLLKIIPTAKFYPVVIDLDKFFTEVGKVEIKENCKTYNILHAPSNTAVKGTNSIHKKLSEFKNKNQNKIQLMLPGENIMNSKKLYSVSRYELFKLFIESDIVIDQIIIGWYGLQSIEGLLTGNHVLCYIEDDLKKYSFDECPVININTLNFEQVLEEVISNGNRNKSEIAKNNLKWVEKHHTIENNNKILLDAWNVN